MRSRTGIRRENRHLRNTGNAHLIPDNKKYAQPKQLIAYYNMSLEEFVKKTRCSVHSTSVGYYANHQHQERTYYMYVDDEKQVVYVKDGNIPKYKKSFQSSDSQTTKRLAWEYIKEERAKELESLNSNLQNKKVVLWAVKIGEPDAYEEIITEHKDRIEQAKVWATKNGYDRFRIAEYENDELPDFSKVLNQSNQVANRNTLNYNYETLKGKLQSLVIYQKKGYEAFIPYQQWLAKSCTMPELIKRLNKAQEDYNHWIDKVANVNKWNHVAKKDITQAKNDALEMIDMHQSDLNNIKGAMEIHLLFPQYSKQ